MKKLLVSILFFGFIGCLVFLTGAPQVAAKDYPEKNIRFIVFMGAGSSTDFIVRGTVPFLEKHLGVRIYVENLPGADGTLAYNAVYKAKPDGYTYGAIALPPVPAIQVLRGGVPWKAEEFTPIYAWASDNQILFVNAETWKSFDDFVKAARGEELTLGLSGGVGPGSSSLLAAVLLAEQLKLKFRNVAFDGAGELMAALAGKHIHCAISMPQTAVGLAKAGKIRPLLSFAAEADPVFPEVPTPKSIGYDIRPLPHIKALAGPPNIPKSHVAVMESAFRKTLEDPNFRKWAKEKNVFLTSMPADALAEEIRKEVELMSTFKKYFPKDAPK